MVLYSPLKSQAVRSTAAASPLLCKLAVSSTEAIASSLLPTDIPLKAYLKLWRQLQESSGQPMQQKLPQSRATARRSADINTEPPADTTRRGELAVRSEQARGDG